MSRDENIISDDDLHRFARQLILNGFDEDHQTALFKSHIAVIGAGGLGSPLIQYLVAAGVGMITIFDDDVVERTNLNRQILHGDPDIGKLKVQSALETAHYIDANSRINLRNERFTETTPLDDITLICDASDNFKTRYEANNVAHAMGVPIVFGGAVRLEGQLAVFRSGVDKNAPCFRCLFPETPDADLAPGCSEAGILGAITGIIGTMMALEAIRQCFITQGISNPLGPGLEQDLMLFDGRYLTFDRIKTKKNQGCLCCGTPD